jgi:hypothetical protein
MKSERRDTPRIPIALEAMLRIDRHFLLFRTRDISLDGVFIETGQIRLPRRRTVELALKIPAGRRRAKLHRFTARLARVTPHGTGLVFDKVGTEAYAALMDLVFSRQAHEVY